MSFVYDITRICKKLISVFLFVCVFRGSCAVAYMILYISYFHCLLQTYNGVQFGNV